MKEIHAELVLKIVDIFCKSEGPNFLYGNPQIRLSKVWRPTVYCHMKFRPSVFSSNSLV
jgi:hypothetical protein